VHNHRLRGSADLARLNLVALPSPVERTRPESIGGSISKDLDELSTEISISRLGSSETLDSPRQHKRTASAGLVGIRRVTSHSALTDVPGGHGLLGGFDKGGGHDPLGRGGGLGGFNGHAMSAELEDYFLMYYERLLPELIKRTLSLRRRSEDRSRTASPSEAAGGEGAKGTASSSDDSSPKGRDNSSNGSSSAKPTGDSDGSN